ncbi:hypothetical protein JYK21_00525, partial [Ralstonia pickettii]|nr:hypothetical protein [Ralstonia pickettii]
EEKKVRSLSMGITAILGIIVILLSLNPPDLIIWLNLFSMGGLEATFIWPIVLGLYWKTGNKYGALASMAIGISSYIIFENFFPQPFGMHSVVTAIALSLIGYIITSIATKGTIRDSP